MDGKVIYNCTYSYTETDGETVSGVTPVWAKDEAEATATITNLRSVQNEAGEVVPLKDLKVSVELAETEKA